jgi:8-oxo-dGTP pyrophosphatase MutT (NUDIX family)
MDNSHLKLKIGVGALVYSASTKRYLFLLRNNTKYSGSWGLVGGKVEDGERTIEGLFREASEEIGTDLSAEKTIPLETFTSENGQFIYHTFVISVDEEFVPVLNDEHRGYCWVNLLDHPRPLHPGVWRTFNFSVILDKIKTLEAVL